MSVPSVFGQSGPVPFSQAAREDKEFGPSIGTAGALQQHIGNTLVIDVIGPVEFDDKINGGKQTAIDARSVVVVETGERFENQRLFPKGIVNQLKAYSNQQVIAVVGTYTTEKYGSRKFVQLEVPSADQVAKANAAIAGGTVREGEYVVGKASATDNKAPF